jgi:uncharacterized protein
MSGTGGVSCHRLGHDGPVQTQRRDWAEGTWLNPPVSAQPDGNSLVVITRKDSDFWRNTAYGFVHDSGHALLVELAVGEAVEVTFLVDFDQQFDQAGLMLRLDERNWIKAGVELTDGVPHVGAVVTREDSDWSMWPVPSWTGDAVTVRASRAADSVTIRVRAGARKWQLLRLAPLQAPGPVGAGPFACSPTGDGLLATFLDFATGPADADLHAN